MIVYYDKTSGDVRGISSKENDSLSLFDSINIDNFDEKKHITGVYKSVKVVGGSLVYEPYIAKTTTLTPRQARLALLQTGLLDELETAIANDRALGIWWEYSLDIQRTNPELLAFAAAYGLTEQQLDDLFELGATL